MDLLQAMAKRRSVRAYLPRRINPEAVENLFNFICELNAESGLHIQLVLNEPQAFSGAMARYGNFKGVTNYIALVGKEDQSLQEKCGYYGEKIVLYAQALGLNTCWVALTYKKIFSAFTVNEGEKLLMVISLGYGVTAGNPRKSKSPEQVSNVNQSSPQWFKNGVDSALTAPTAMNQQKFYFTLVDKNTVKAEAGIGFYTKTDLGIVKYHFELGAGKQNFTFV